MSPFQQKEPSLVYGGHQGGFLFYIFLSRKKAKLSECQDLESRAVPQQHKHNFSCSPAGNCRRSDIKSDQTFMDNDDE